MSGQPAARISDAVVNGKIVTGSNTVLIGSQGGVACSECPGGLTVGHPVNPALGAKVLSGPSDLDFALPGALPLIWQRQYSSYVNAEHGGYCGILGYGWSLPLELRLSVHDRASLPHSAPGQTTGYEWSLTDQLLARHLPATDAPLPTASATNGAKRANCSAPAPSDTTCATIWAPHKP